MSRTLLRAALAACTLLAAAGSGAAAAPTEKDKKLLADVSAKLMAVCDRPAGFEWDQIDFGFTSDDEGKGVNAYSMYTLKDGKRVPVVRIGERMMAKVVWGENAGDEAGAEDRLAFVVGHELGHLVKDHFTKTGGDKAPPVAAAFKRDQEIEADLYGLQLLLKAGFDLGKALGGVERIKTFLKDQGLGYSSFEGLGAGHPSWDDRLIKADKDKAELWKAMAAFSNGVTFLTTEDYRTAIQCFDKVTRQFPGCYEAWANLGYACLMKYCDQWDKKDLKEQGVGNVVVGGFYNRIKSVELRGKDKTLWFSAVGALRESNRLQGGQTVVLANLGLAYLLAPDGKDVGESTRFFAEAAAAAKKDKDLDPVVHATLLINLGVNSLAAGDADKAMAQIDAGEKVVRSLAVAAKRAVPKFDPAIWYARALVHAGKGDKAEKEKAYALLEKYLRTCSLYSLWWDQAYDKYAEVCKAIEKEPKAKEAFKKDRPEPARLVTGVKLTVNGKEQTVTLGADIEDVEMALGKGQQSVAVQGTSTLRIRYEKEGLELLADEKVLAIILTGPNAPAVPLVGKMTGTGKVGEIKVGMTAVEVEELLGDLYDPLEVTSTAVSYNFYREQGVAVRVQKGKVIAVVVVVAPHK